MTGSQFGSKAVKHMREWGLDVSNAKHRQAFKDKIEDIATNPDRVVNGTFAGQGENGGRGPVQFRIKGRDVVITTRKGAFVSILKDGINSTSVRQAIGCTGTRLC
jgi:filamentous hemagglutinin